MGLSPSAPETFWSICTESDFALKDSTTTDLERRGQFSACSHVQTGRHRKAQHVSVVISDLRGLSLSGRCRRQVTTLYWNSGVGMVAITYMESPHHLFCDCPVFEANRVSTLAGISCLSQEVLEDVPLVVRCRVCQAIPSDDSAVSWPLGWNRWFLGHTPLLKRDFPSLPDRVIAGQDSSLYDKQTIYLVAPMS
ncbi:uncharacterized protein EI90DRAFT_826673 [Cantharellus anzutake]|uniref:uncharacterized protein n=1 Tax=Cantharellus anzutake TaxID=1750568 RepID=UPI00190864FE|nr:uncharacterized protein EI90DRAFT_826673 [Cantharellus anzutake]KAF8343077.1 hypothetical protein EI90DRAFT_826673 [Cantharellus anzutake]